MRRTRDRNLSLYIKGGFITFITNIFRFSQNFGPLLRDAALILLDKTPECYKIFHSGYKYVCTFRKNENETECNLYTYFYFTVWG